MELALAVAMIALAYAWAMAAHRQSVVTVVHGRPALEDMADDHALSAAGGRPDASAR
jgi:hypothetical protein